MHFERNVDVSRYLYIYHIYMSLEKEQVAYIGLASTTFKERYNNHKNSFNHEKYENEAELSKYVWKLKKKIQNSVSLGK